MRFVFIILFASLLNPISLHANEQDLMASALKLQKTITPDLSTKDKLARYELVISKIDQIIEGYASTEIGLELLATDSIGNLDVTKLRSDYLKELIEYYDTTCKVSPSYACLGFVSLSTANEICEKPSNIDSYVKASENLINAIQIFDGQFDDNKYEDVALSVYRQCVKDTSNDFTRDYLNSQLIDTLLITGEESKARGVIEQMKTPFFKFNSVIALRKFKDQAFDSAYVERLKKFIGTIDNDDDRWFAATTFAIARLEGVIEGKNELFTIEENSYRIKPLYWHSSYTVGECGTFQNQYSFDLYVKKIFVRAEQLGSLTSELFVDGNSYTSDQFSGDCINQLMILKLMAFEINTQESKLKELDKKIQEERLKLMGRQDELINIRMTQSSLEDIKRHQQEDYEAEAKLRDLQAQKEGLSDESRKIEIAKDVFDFYKSNSSISTTQAQLYYLDKYVNDELSLDFYKSQYDGWARYMSRVKDTDILYQIYKKKVDFGNACDASSILFKELASTKHYEDGINYFISSPSMDPSIKYNCGDEDLELLLN